MSALLFLKYNKQSTAIPTGTRATETPNKDQVSGINQPYCERRKTTAPAGGVCKTAAKRFNISILGMKFFVVVNSRSRPRLAGARTVANGNGWKKILNRTSALLNYGDVRSVDGTENKANIPVKIPSNLNLNPNQHNVERHQQVQWKTRVLRNVTRCR